MSGRRGRGSAAPTALAQLLGRLPALTLVVGKGGVGKTTCSAGIAAHLAAGGDRTLLLSTDPAGSVGAALGAEIAGGTDSSLSGRPRLLLRQLTARDARRAFLERWGAAIVDIVDRGTYLDRDDAEGMVEAALPGSDEIFALLALAEVIQDCSRGVYDRVVVDTAPTGHTLRLLQLPKIFTAMIALLDTMQEKHRFMVRALTHRYREDRADAFLAHMRQALETVAAALADPGRCAAVLVARLEPIVQAETTRYVAALRELGITVQAVVMNAVERLDTTALSIGGDIVAHAPGALQLTLQHLPEPPTGIDAIEGSMQGLMLWRGGSERQLSVRLGTEGLEVRGESERSLFLGGAPRADTLVGHESSAASTGPTLLSALLRTLTFTAGKGGVGKTTVSCTLAIAAADAAAGGRNILLVSTDPAPSIADALGQKVGDADVEITEVPGLVARQMDAAAAFRGLRDRYRARVDGIFDSFVAQGVDATYDRAILRDLLELAPPGVDELYALASLGEMLAAERFDRIVVDPAPTGHFLRLLEMPALALDWSHRLMRLILKYRELADLGDVAEELLVFARRTRAFETLLHDPSRAGLVIVALDEPLVRRETGRLAGALREVSIPVLGLAWNRVGSDEQYELEPLPAASSVLQVLAPASKAPLVGVQALRAWFRVWQVLDGRGYAGTVHESRDRR